MVFANFEIERGILRVGDQPDNLLSLDNRLATRPSHIRRSATSRPISRSPFAISTSSRLNLARSTSQLLTVTDYEFDFEINLDLALRRGATSVRVTANSLNERGLSTTPAAVNIISQIQSQPRIRRNELKSVQSRAMATRVIDLTAYFNNNLTGVVNSNSATPILNISKRIVIKRSDEFKRQDRAVPYLESTVVDRGPRAQPTFIKRDLRESACNLLLNGIDPADVASLDANIDAEESIAGLASGKQRPSRDPADLIRERYFLFIKPEAVLPENTAGLSSQTEVAVFAQVRSEFRELSARLAIPIANLKDQFEVKFEVLDAQGIVIDTETRLVDHASNVRVFNSPVTPPEVTLSKRTNKLGVAQLRVKQADPRATSFTVYKKIFSRVSPFVRDYEELGSFTLQYGGGEINVPVVVDSTNPVIFRVVASGPGNAYGATFKNVVVPPTSIMDQKHIKRFRSASVVPRIVKEGVQIEVREIPCGTVGISIERKDHTLKERLFTSPAAINSIKKVNDKTSTPIVFTDSSVKDRHVYEYRAVLFDKRGDPAPAGRSTFVEYVPLQESIVDTQVTNNRVLTDNATGELDVTFDIQTTVIETNTQALKNLLDEQGLLEFFDDDIKNERELLEKLVAHKIQRIDLQTGEIEDMGVQTGLTFSDRNSQVNYGTRPLRPGTTYRYEVFALLRSAETLFENYVKEVTDSNGRVYRFNPTKFLHPLALGAGNITTPESRLRNHARDELAFGRVGNIIRLDVPIDDGAPSITGASAKRLDPSRIAVRWKRTSSQREYDHFMIMKEQRGRRAFAGAVHNQSRSSSYEFVYELQPEDRGTIRFIIVPVLSDYSIARSETTKGIVTG